MTHWAAHTPSAEEREEKYEELKNKGILDEVEKLFMAKEIKAIGRSAEKKDEKKQIISNDLRKAFGRFLALLRDERCWMKLTVNRNRLVQVLALFC